MVNSESDLTQSGLIFFLEHGNMFEGMSETEVTDELLYLIIFYLNKMGLNGDFITEQAFGL